MRTSITIGVIAWALAICGGAAPVHAQRPAAIAGRVLDQGGQPAAEAWVYLIRRTHPELPAGLAECLGDDSFECEIAATDAKGRFRITTSGSWPLAIYARRGDAEFSKLGFPVLPGDFTELELQQPPSATGQITEPGPKRPRPARGAPVILRQRPRVTDDPVLWGYDLTRAAPFVPFWPRTDANGEFAIKVLPGGVLDLGVGRRGTTFWLARAQPVVDLGIQFLPPIRPVSVRLLEQGKPVPSAVAVDLGRPGQHRPADASGTVEIPDLSVTGLLIAPTRHIPVYLPVDRELREQREHDIALRKGNRLRGRLLRADGAALADARMVFSRPFRGAHGVETGTFAWTAKTGPGGELDFAWLEPNSPITGYVELDGRFVCFLLRRPAGEIDLGELRISDQHEIRGRITAADRTPAAGAWVFVRPALPPSDAGLDQDLLRLSMSRVAVADRGGRFVVDGLTPGEYELLVRHRGNRLARRSAVARPESEVTDIQLEPAPVVRGAVSTPDGKPLVATVYLTQAPEQVGAQRIQGIRPFRSQVRCDTEGRFEFADLPDNVKFVLRATAEYRGKLRHTGLMDVPTDGTRIPLTIQ